MTSHIQSATKLSYDEYALIPDDGQQHEIIDGEHYVNSAPGTYHQTLSKRLQYELYRQIELQGKGLVFNAPCDVQLSEHDIVQPDLIVLLGATRQIVTPAKLLGVPDLLVEITSPSSNQYDRTLKKQLYERAAVREYWIVDARQRTVEQMILADGAYGSQHPTDELRPHGCSEVVLRLSQLW